VKAKHTPGPWKEFQDEDSHDIIGPNGVHIATVEPVTSFAPAEEQAANGMLLAAAPELLESLERLLQLADRRMPIERYAQDVAIFELSRNSIRKAKGARS